MSVKTIVVSVPGYGEATFSNRTVGAAFADAWRAFNSACDCSFKDFMKRANRIVIPNPPGVGDPIRVCGRDAFTLEPLAHSTRFIYADDGHAMVAHHSDIEVIQCRG